MIYVEKSNHITFKDITIVDAPFWTLHPAGCDDVLIDRIRILNDLDVANSDGIDPDHCSNVRILGCHVECADDCICLKASKGNAEYGPCENIIIDGCTLVSTSAAIKIGTEGVGDFRNVLVQNCVISAATGAVHSNSGRRLGRECKLFQYYHRDPALLPGLVGHGRAHHHHRL